jgi:hypothetical protein
MGRLQNTAHEPRPARRLQVDESFQNDVSEDRLNASLIAGKVSGAAEREKGVSAAVESAGLLGEFLLPVEKPHPPVRVRGDSFEGTDVAS